MKVKSLALWAAALAAVAAATYFWQHRPAKRPADPRVGQLLAPLDLLRSATRLRLTQSGAEAVLVRDSAGQWTVQNYHGLPVDFDKVTRLTRDLAQAKFEALATRNPDRVKRLELDKCAIEIVGTGSAPLILEFGKNADEGGRYVRLSGEPAAYVTGFDAWIDAAPRSWAQSRLTEFKSSEVKSVRIQTDSGPELAATRAEKDALLRLDTPTANPGAQLDADRLSGLLDNLGDLRFIETADTSAPEVLSAREHARKIEVTMLDGATWTFLIGRRPAPPPSAPAATPTPSPAPAEAAAPASTPAPGTSTAAVAATPAEKPKPGPVYAVVTHSRADAPINQWMRSRAFEVGDWIYEQLPTEAAALLQKPPAETATPAAQPHGAGGPTAPSAPAEAPAAPGGS